MAKYATILFLVLVSVLVFSNNANANIFPNDARTIYLDVTAGTGGVLLPASTKNRTIVYATIRCGASTTGAIDIGGTQFLTNVATNTDTTSFAPQFIPAGQAVNYTKTSNKEVAFRIVYVDYDLTLVPNYLVTFASVSFPSEPLLSNVASNSKDIIPVYATMTAGDIGIMLGLFTLVVLMLLEMLWRKNKFS